MFIGATERFSAARNGKKEIPAHSNDGWWYAVTENPADLDIIVF